MSDIDGLKARLLEKITSMSVEDQEMVNNVFEVAKKVLTSSPVVNTNTEEGVKLSGWINGIRKTMRKRSDSSAPPFNFFSERDAAREAERSAAAAKTGGKKRYASRRDRRRSSRR
jgi:hypothetical protein